MSLLLLLIALYLLLGLALATFIMVWLMAYCWGVKEVVTGKWAILLVQAYRRRLVQLARGSGWLVWGRACWLCLYAMLAWPGLGYFSPVLRKTINTTIRCSGSLAIKVTEIELINTHVYLTTLLM